MKHIAANIGKTPGNGSMPRIPKIETELKPRTSVGSLSRCINTWCITEIDRKQVIYREEPSNPARELPPKVLGKLAKIIDTCNEKDDKKAAVLVEAELNRLRGEMREPELTATQLTVGSNTPGFHISYVYSAKYAIYKPENRGSP